MKNYLVGAVRPVSTTWGYWKTQEEEEQALKGHEKYNEMYKLSRNSARKFLQGEWEEIKFIAPVLDARLYQIAQWYTIKELWHREPCNILAMGADTLFMRPTEIFGQFKEMRMFNYTDPRQHAEFEHYFNDDIRYYPADMDPAVWAVGERRMGEWFTHEQAHWDWGQLIHNYQFWSQDIPADDLLKPNLNWMAHNLRDLTPEIINWHEVWNRCSLADANIVHFSGSRGAEQTVATMQIVSTAIEKLQGQ
jgi:hypothetical protein